MADPKELEGNPTGFPTKQFDVTKAGQKYQEGQSDDPAT